MPLSDFVIVHFADIRSHHTSNLGLTECTLLNEWARINWYPGGSLGVVRGLLLNFKYSFRQFFF